MQGALPRCSSIPERGLATMWRQLGATCMRAPPHGATTLVMQPALAQHPAPAGQDGQSCGLTMKGSLTSTPVRLNFLGSVAAVRICGRQGSAGPRVSGSWPIWDLPVATHHPRGCPSSFAPFRPSSRPAPRRALPGSWTDCRQSRAQTGHPRLRDQGRQAADSSRGQVLGGNAVVRNVAADHS